MFYTLIELSMNKYEGLLCQCTLKRTKKFLSKLNRITAWCSISCYCHNLTTFALSPRKLIECGLFLFSNTAVSIVILFCVIILWSVGTNFAWNDITHQYFFFFNILMKLQQPHPYGMSLLLKTLFSRFPLIIHYGHSDPYPCCLDIFLFYE